MLYREWYKSIRCMYLFRWWGMIQKANAHPIHSQSLILPVQKTCSITVSQDPMHVLREALLATVTLYLGYQPCESMFELPSGMGWSPPAARVCRRPFCLSAEIWTYIKKKNLHPKKATLIESRHKELNNYRQGSEWCIAVGVVFDIMTNYQSIHDLRVKEILQTGSF